MKYAANAYLLAKIADDTAENEQHFAEILPILRMAALVELDFLHGLGARVARRRRVIGVSSGTSKTGGR